jgi:hypothetical protein
MTQVLVTGGDIHKAFHNQMKFRHHTRTLAGNLTLVVTDPTLQFVDPGGANRTITLPAEEDSEGLVFIIANRADAANEIITVANDAAGAICTPNTDESAIVFCDGTTWAGLVGDDL